jgi:hypothetical protein
VTHTLDQQIRTELNQLGDLWLTWTQLANGLRAVLDLFPAGSIAGDAVRETVARELGITDPSNPQSSTS